MEGLEIGNAGGQLLSDTAGTGTKKKWCNSENLRLESIGFAEKTD